MTDYDYLHEIEHVELRSAFRRPLSELLPLFKELGFTLHYDVLTLDREGTIPPWESSSIVSVETRCTGKDVSDFDDGEWDTIRLSYLFATLPFYLTSIFVDIAFTVAKRLFLPILLAR